MSENLVERIEDLNDRKAVRMLEFYSARVFEGMETSPKDMIAGIPTEFREQAPFDSVLEMSSEEQSRPLTETESAALSRELLLGFARDPIFAPSLEEALDEYQDEELFAGAILATGVAVSMIIVASTTKFKGKVGDFKVEKEAADANFIEALLKYFPKYG